MHHATNNIFPYTATAGEVVLFSADGGICTYENDCCEADCVRVNFGTVDMWVELWNSDMTERIALYEETTAAAEFEDAGLYK